MSDRVLAIVRNRRFGDTTLKHILRRKPKGFKGASNDSRSVQGLIDQYVTGCARRKLDVRDGQARPPGREFLASMPGVVL